MRQSKKSKTIEERLGEGVNLADDDPEVPEGMVSSRRFQKEQKVPNLLFPTFRGYLHADVSLHISVNDDLILPVLERHH